jgi:hypothetical protein
VRAVKGHLMTVLTFAALMSCKASFGNTCWTAMQPQMSQEECKQRARVGSQLSNVPTSSGMKFAFSHNLVGGGAHFWCEFDAINPDGWTENTHRYQIVQSVWYLIGFQAWAKPGKLTIANFSTGVVTVSPAWGDDAQPNLNTPFPVNSPSMTFTQDGDTVTLKDSGPDNAEIGGKVNVREGAFFGTFRSHLHVYGTQGEHLTSGNFKCVYLGVRRY